ncbi:PAS domain-containing sensor histidine kinase [Shinella sp. HZN7]|uniref:PAS domain-containing sensor histidine kinase n=1 Tax=Shinella sp. (strain HZN7) TaxID=879274 RepID=UPI0007DA52F8|nr:PAS domain-containing sensor histidine kinase [Shinella sp. HZN7]ANH02912.1 PAS domain-containing sensor histidine kinase [Shinella sp. HZN7]
MSAKQYPFIDVAVHERVRLPFARGEAVVLFSTDMARVLWANGRGAALFGHDNIYDFLDARPDRADVAFRQLVATARQVQVPGDRRTFLMRIGSGFRSVPVTAAVESVTIRPGDDAMLFSAPVDTGRQSPQEAAAAMLTGFDDPDTHMAVLDGAGAIVAASDGFDGLSISPETRRALVEAAGRSAERLVKRPIATGRGHLPAAIGRIAADPPLHLLFAVETILGHLDPDGGAAEPVAETPAAATADTEIPAPAEETQVRDEQIVEAAEPVSDPEASRAEDEAAIDGAVPSASPVEPIAASDDDAIEALASDDLPQAGAPAESLPEVIAEEHVAAHAGEAGAERETPVADNGGTGNTKASFLFNPQGRPIRFVWKIDAEGRFSEISDEFAAAVGPHAAGIAGERFSDVAARFDLDPEGKIGDLLRRRDTWSGKTILWPAEGTNLVVPVDLAALPTYSRNREFDGFRGFGIVRIADAAPDPHARGLALASAAEDPSVEMEEVFAEEAGTLLESAAEELGDTPDMAEDALAGAADMADAASGMPDEAVRAEEPAPVTQEAAETEEAGADAADGENTQAVPDDDEQDVFRGERPALRLVETPARRQSDKIVQLETRRNRGGLFDGLSTGEQAAFREIARQLGETFGKRKPEDQPSAEVMETAAGGEQPDETIHDARPETSEGDEATGATPVAEETDAEVPGLEIGPHADDLLSEAQAEARTAIAPPRRQMDYGLTAAVVDVLPVALLVHVGDRLIHANPEFFRLTGYASIEDLEASGGLDILLAGPDEDAEDGDGTMALRHADGESTSAVHARLQSIRWEDGTALMLALTPLHTKPALSLVETAPAPAAEAEERNADQTAAAALRIEVSELRSILETATDGVVVVGQDGDIRSMNRSASALFNYDEDETRGRPFAMLFAHESQKAVLDYLAGLAGHGVASVLNDGREVIGREAAGGFIPLFMTMGRLSSSAGYCAVIRDITQWKRTEEELRNAKRAAETANAHKSDFLARVSHEIRTPLNAIIGFSDMMATERFGPIGHPRYIEYANDIGRSGRHVLDIVNDLLDISKIEAGEMELEFTAVGLNETIAEAVSLVQPQANAQRVIIRTSLSANVPQIVADLRSIKQIALNILSNAIRFTPSGGQIVVSTAYEANGSVVLRIRDTGVGMTRSELEQAMKPFRQVTTGARKRGDGTGLGLPLTKAMVDANRANFAISSTPNEGTLVEVIFPSPRVLAD